MDEATKTAAVWAAINSYAVDRRRFLQVAGITGAAATLAACSPGGGAAPTPSGGATGPSSNAEIPGPPWEGGERGGRAVVLWEDPTLTYDPPLAYGQGDYYGLQNVYRGLVFYGPDAEPQLDVAESVDLSEDGLTYTFKIREGVNFHNGRAVTAEDFKWTFERSTSADIGSWVQGFLGSVEGHADFVDGSADEITGIVAEDERTLVLKLTQPDVTILGVLGIPPFYVLPKEEVERFGDKWPENPVGCGPFKLKSWDAGASTIVFERNEDYVWADDLPYFDEVEYRWNVGADIAYLQVSKNEADATYAVPPSAIPRIKQNAAQAERFKEWSSFTLTYYEFDISKPPFDDVRVRQAVNYAFNKEKLAPLGYVPDGHFYPKGLLGYDESAPVYEYDPDKARALLEEAGASDISFTLPVFGEDTTTAQMLQQDLKDIGITIDIKTLSVNPYDIGFELPNQYRMWAMGWGMGLPDPSELFSSLIRTDAPSNFKKYSNEKIDELGVAAITEADRDKRAGMYAEIERLLLEDAPYLFVGVNSAPTFISEQLQNFYYEPILRTYYDRYWKTGAYETLSATAALAQPAAATTRRRGGRQVLRGLARPDFIIGALLVAFWAFCALFPTVLTSADPIRIRDDGLTILGEPLAPGTGSLLLGTDSLGRDFFARVVHGARVAMVIALVPNAIALAFATLVGVLAGVMRGKVEYVLMRVTEAIMVLPGFLIAMAVISTFGSSTTVLILTIVAFSWTYTARVIYGETLRLREMLFVEAALSVGAGRWRIAATHIVPHLKPLLVVYFTMNAAFMVLLEAGLGFLGFGIQPPTPSWGLMLAEARDEFFYPWLIIVPGICLATLSIGFYLLGQGIQNAGRPAEKAVVL